jgi:hypothetical protein
MVGSVRAGLRAGMVVLAFLMPRPAAAAQPAPPAPPGEKDSGALSLVVATEGRQFSQASYPFVVGEGASISGKLRFLSQEYPEYFGSEFNDLFSVALATPQGAVVLATGNLNNSSWGAGSQGYSGTAATIEISEDLSRFAGQTVELQIVVANVADMLFDSAVAVFDLRIDDQPPCRDDRLKDLHGIPDSPARDRLDGFDQQFAGRDGARFRNLVETIAREAGISPGLLAVNALTERSGTSSWLTADAVQAQESGVDDWAGLEASIRDRLPGAPLIPTTATSEVFENEQGREIPIVEFANGRDALRAMAWTLRFAAVRMTEDGSATYSALPPNERYALQRFAFNRGIPAAVDLVRETGASGESVLVDKGAVGSKHPQRTATVRGAQAVHLANSIFGEGASCR